MRWLLGYFVLSMADNILRVEGYYDLNGCATDSGAEYEKHPIQPTGFYIFVLLSLKAA